MLFPENMGPIIISIRPLIGIIVVGIIGYYKLSSILCWVQLSFIRHLPAPPFMCVIVDCVVVVIISSLLNDGFIGAELAVVLQVF